MSKYTEAETKIKKIMCEEIQNTKVSKTYLKLGPIYSEGLRTMRFWCLQI